MHEHDTPPAPRKPDLLPPVLPISPRLLRRVHRSGLTAARELLEADCRRRERLEAARHFCGGRVLTRVRLARDVFSLWAAVAAARNVSREEWLRQALEVAVDSGTLQDRD